MFGAVKPGFRSLATLKLVMNVVGELQTEKKQLRHRAVSLRQHGFLVSCCQNEVFSLKMYLCRELCVYETKLEYTTKFIVNV